MGSPVPVAQLAVTVPVDEAVVVVRREFVRALRESAGSEATPVQQRLLQIADAFEREA